MSTIFYLLLLLSFTSCVLSTKDDERVLLKMKKQLGNPSILQTWVKGFNFCDFKTSNVFIACTSTGRVNILTIQELNITAPFPDAICNLTELQDLYIDRMPGLYGPIPSCITKLPNLRRLIITRTSLSGSVLSFYNHTNILGMNLRSNHLSGKIPPSLSTCPNLNVLILSSNYLTGTIPPGLVHGSLPSLELDNNNLTGKIPKIYGWVDFQIIILGNNQLRGDASFLFGKQKKTVNIELQNNNFEFDLSQVEFSDYIYGFDISHNKIYGNVPESFATAAGLYYPKLSFKRLCGELPQGSNMGRFNVAVFENNACLCGSPLPPCSISAPALAPVSGPPF